MGLFSELSEWWAAALDPDGRDMVRWPTEDRVSKEGGYLQEAAVMRLLSLVVRCDVCKGDPNSLTFRNGETFTMKGGTNVASVVVCPAGCVNGWQPSEKLITALDATFGLSSKLTPTAHREVEQIVPYAARAVMIRAVMQLLDATTRGGMMAENRPGLPDPGMIEACCPGADGQPELASLTWSAGPLLASLQTPLQTKQDRRNENLVGYVRNRFPGRRKIGMLKEVSDFLSGFASTAEDDGGDLEQAGLIREVSRMVWDLAEEMDELRKEVRG